MVSVYALMFLYVFMYVGVLLTVCCDYASAHALHTSISSGQSSLKHSVLIVGVGWGGCKHIKVFVTAVFVCIKFATVQERSYHAKETRCLKLFDAKQ